MSDIFVINAHYSGSDELFIADPTIKASDVLSAYRSGKVLFLRILNLHDWYSCIVDLGETQPQVISLGCDVTLPLDIVYHQLIPVSENPDGFPIEITNVSKETIDFSETSDNHIVFTCNYCNFVSITNYTKRPLMLMLTLQVGLDRSDGNDSISIRHFTYSFTCNKYDANADDVSPVS